MSDPLYFTKRLDHLGIVAGTCQRIDLIGQVDALMGPTERSVSVGEAVQAMVLNALGFGPRALYLTPDFFQNKPLDLLIRPVTLAVYARVDGGFAVWDGHRAPVDDLSEAQGAILLSPQEVWQGKTERRDKEEITLCSGLLRDWLDWEARYPEVFQRFAACLKELSGAGDEAMIPGRPTRVRLGEARDIPTLDLPYGNVPVTLLSAGMRRVLSLAYVLVWAWEEHRRSAELVGQPPTSDLVVLLDEAEAHLHPQWQRTLLPALVRVIQRLGDRVAVQLFVATHAPLVTLSLEPLFDPARDALWMLDLVEGRVERTRDDWRLRGDVSAWLTSEVFDLKAPRSIEAEQAILAADAVMKAPAPDPEALRAVHDQLRAVLKDTDPYWVRWLFVAERRGLTL